MRLKLLLLLFSIVFLSSPIYSQNNMKFGLNFGVNLANASINYQPLENVDISTSGLTRLIFGGLIEIKLLDNIFIQPEFQLIQKGFKSTYTDKTFDPTEITDYENNFDYFSIPLLIKYKFNNNSDLKPSVFVGPELGFKLDAYDKNGDKYSEDDWDKMDIVLNAGVGFDYAISSKIDIFANLRYSLGIKNINKTFDPRGDNITKLNGIQFLIGIKSCLFNCEKSDIIDEKKSDIDLSPQKQIVMKEFDLAKYDIPFFISGYYRVNTQESLNELIELKKNKLKSATYIESFNKGSQKYNQYKIYAQSVENVFNVLCITSKDELFPNFKSYAKSNEILEISIYGYADPRPITGKYYEDETINFIDKNNVPFSMNNGDALDNFKLAGIRSFYTGKLLDKLLSEKSSDYIDLKNSSRIKYRYISMGVSNDGNELEAQRRIKIVYTRKKQ